MAFPLLSVNLRSSQDTRALDDYTAVYWIKIDGNEMKRQIKMQLPFSSLMAKNQTARPKEEIQKEEVE